MLSNPILWFNKLPIEPSSNIKKVFSPLIELRSKLLQITESGNLFSINLLEVY